MMRPGPHINVLRRLRGIRRHGDVQMAIKAPCDNCEYSMRLSRWRGATVHSAVYATSQAVAECSQCLLRPRTVSAGVCSLFSRSAGVPVRHADVCAGPLAAEERGAAPQDM